MTPLLFTALLATNLTFAPAIPESVTISIGKSLGTYHVSRYYSPTRNQWRYYSHSYEHDYRVNCSGDCLKSADGTDLRYEKPLTIAACPPSIRLGTRLRIEGIGIVRCADRGGAIVRRRIDLWAGISMGGLNHILTDTSTAGAKRIWKL